MLCCVWFELSVVLSGIMHTICLSVCTVADIPLHVGIRQTSDEGSPIVVSQPDGAQVS